jgi:hypothetical protein
MSTAPATPFTFVVLKDFTPAGAASQGDAARWLNEMSPAQYRDFLISMDPSFKARLCRKGYRRGGITPEEYFS